MTLREWHHGYVGLLLMLYWFLRILSRGFEWWAISILAAGVWLLADDAVQHARQKSGEPDYRSPVNRLWGWILRRFE